VHDIALRAQVLQGYEEFKVRLVILPSLSVCSCNAGGAAIYLRPFVLCSSPMDLSRPSLAYWDGRRWSYSWRGSSRCGRGSGILRRTRN
jgi:hypothetical protein